MFLGHIWPQHPHGVHPAVVLALAANKDTCRDDSNVYYWNVFPAVNITCRPINTIIRCNLYIQHVNKIQKNTTSTDNTTHNITGPVVNFLSSSVHHTVTLISSDLISSGLNCTGITYRA